MWSSVSIFHRIIFTKPPYCSTTVINHVWLTLLLPLGQMTHMASVRPTEALGGLVYPRAAGGFKALIYPQPTFTERKKKNSIGVKDGFLSFTDRLNTDKVLTILLKD